MWDFATLKNYKRTGSSFLSFTVSVLLVLTAGVTLREHFKFSSGALPVFLKCFPAVLSLSLLAGCNQNAPQAIPKGLLVTADGGRIIVVGDGFSCDGVTKAHPGEDGLKDAVSAWVECSQTPRPVHTTKQVDAGTK